MPATRRERIARVLRDLAEAHAASMNVLEQAMNLICEEFNLDPLTYLQTRPLAQEANASTQHLFIDKAMLSVSFAGKSCFLGNTLPFKFLCTLARRPYSYVSYEQLLEEVWACQVSDGAIRTVAKNLRNLLRKAGLAEVANAVDGSVYGHYILKLPT